MPRHFDVGARGRVADMGCSAFLGRSEERKLVHEWLQQPKPGRQWRPRRFHSCTTQCCCHMGPTKSSRNSLAGVIATRWFQCGGPVKAAYRARQRPVLSPRRCSAKRCSAKRCSKHGCRTFAVRPPSLLPNRGLRGRGLGRARARGGRRETVQCWVTLGLFPIESEALDRWGNRTWRASCEPLNHLPPWVRLIGRVPLVLLGVRPSSTSTAALSTAWG
jgi:hypothetical protein